MKVTSLKNVCNIDMGQAPAGTSYNTEGIGYPLIAGAGDYGRITPEPKKFTNKPTKITQKKDIILCVRATIGDLNLADKEYCLGRGVAGLRANKEQLDDSFLWYFLLANKAVLSRHATGSTFKQINRNAIDNLQIPLPPLPVQKQIAEVLEKADTLRKQAQQVEKELNQLVQSLFLEMFGDPITSSNSTRLGQHLDFLTSGGRGWAKYYSKTGARFIRSFDVQMNELSEKDPAYVLPPDGAEAKRTKIQERDVLLTITGSKIGRVCWLPESYGDAFISQHVALLRINKEKFLPEFISYFLSMPSLGQRQIKKAQYGQTKPGLNFNQIRSFVIPDIELSIQQAFLKKVKVIREMALQNLDEINQHRDLFNALLQKAFKGELDFSKVGDIKQS